MFPFPTRSGLTVIAISSRWHFSKNALHMKFNRPKENENKQRQRIDYTSFSIPFDLFSLSQRNFVECGSIFGQPLEIVCSARVVISGFHELNRQTKLVENYYSIICYRFIWAQRRRRRRRWRWRWHKISNDSIFRYSRMGNVYCSDYGC